MDPEDLIVLYTLQQSIDNAKRLRSYAIALLLNDDADEEEEKSQKNPPEWWIYPRSQHWKLCIQPSDEFFNEAKFKKTYRMRRDTFEVLLDKLQHSITGQDTNWRLAIPARHRLAIFLHYISKASAMDDIADLYGVGRSTISDILVTVSDAILQDLLPKYVKWPTVARMQQIATDFEMEYEIPQCVGCIDGSHIPIASPEGQQREYRNRKGFYSIVLQGTVDPDRRFINANVGWPGRVNDSRVFFNSPLSHSLEEKCAQMNDRMVPTGDAISTPIPYYLLGDSAYGNTKRMVTTFEIGECERDRIIKKLNKRLAGIRYVVEHAFGLLKGRFRLLLTPMPTAKRNVQKATNIVMSCVALHNFLIDQNDKFNLTPAELAAQHQEMREMGKKYRQKYPEAPAAEPDARIPDAPENTRQSLYKYVQYQQTQYDAARAAGRLE